ncbi:MAG: Ig-like domain-containing protein [Bacteroidales bacterium]|nr:Ig-like domain-containing protein [Bacteroidales bacterium]
MKKLVLFSASIAALIAFSSCSKESESPASFNPGEKVTITFSTGKSIETKSAIAEEGATQATYEWTNEDAYNFKLYLVDGGNLTEVTEKTVTKTSGTELSVTATVNAAASYTFRAIIAGDFKAAGQAKVKSSQSPSATDYDPSADVLVSADLVVTDVNATNTLQFARKAVVNKMILAGLEDGEKINRIEITSDVNLTGYYDGSAMVGDGKKIILNYPDIVVPASGEVPVYFTSIPNSGHTLSVEVTTNKNTYTKSFGAGGINFVQGKMSRFSVALPTGTPVSSVWNRVNNTTSLEEGDFIVIASSGADYAISTEERSNNRGSVAVTSTDSGATITIGDDVEIFTLEGSDDEWYFKTSSNQYLYAASSSNNYLKVAANKSTATNNGHGIWTIDANASGIASVTANCTDSYRNVMMFNSGNNPKIFSCYASAGSYTTLSVYKGSFSSTKYPTTWNLASIRVAQLPNKTEYNAGETLAVSGLVVIGVYEDASDANNTKEEVISNGSLTLTPSTSTPLVVSNTSVSVSYGGQNTSFDIVVTKATPSLSVSPASPVEVQKGKTQTLVVTGTDGDLSFTSDDPSIASVNDEGVVTGVSKGSATITINSAATANYFAGSTTVVINVTDDHTVTFIAGTDTGSTSVTKDGITISMSTMSRDDNYRVYANTSMTVSAASGKIAKIVLTCTASGTSSYGPGQLSGTGYSYSGTIGTWTGSSDSVSLEAAAQCRITQIVVTYE